MSNVVSTQDKADADKKVENLFAVIDLAKADGLTIRPVEYLSNQGLKGDALAYAIGEFITKRYGISTK